MKRKMKAIFSKTTELTDFLAMQDRQARDGLGYTEDSDSDVDDYNYNNDQVIVDDSYSSSSSA